MTGELGYYFHRARQPGGPENPQLDFNLYAVPTEQHFDPERARLSIVEPSGDLGQVTLIHPWSGQKQFRVCAGRLYLHDRNEKVVEAFSFGGDLMVTLHEKRTSCSLTSPAPILELQEGHDMVTVLVSEFESLLARRRAEWAGDETGFEKRLTQTDPFTLFVVGLATIQSRLDQAPKSVRRGRYQQAKQVIESAIQTVQENGNWPAAVPALADIL